MRWISFENCFSDIEYYLLTQVNDVFMHENARDEKSALPHLLGKHDRAPPWHGSCVTFWSKWHNLASLPVRGYADFSLLNGTLSIPMDPKYLNLMYWSIIVLLGVFKHRCSLGLKLVLKQDKNEMNFEFWNWFWNKIKIRRTLSFWENKRTLWNQNAMSDYPRC
jgi:hypothetical protein